MTESDDALESAKLDAQQAEAAYDPAVELSVALDAQTLADALAAQAAVIAAGPPIINLAKPLPIDLSVLCKPVPGMPMELKLTLPGGVELSTLTGAIPPSPMAYALAALDGANKAMAPLTPIFKIIETITAIQKCLSVIPDIIGPPPNPKKLVDALEELGLLLVDLAKMMPIFSIPLLVVQLIDVIIATIDGAASELTALARFAQNIAAAQFAVSQSPGLGALITCAQLSRDEQMSNIEKTFASINPIIDLINLFGKAAGLTHPIPPFTDSFPTGPLGTAYDKTVEYIQGVADALRDIRAYIPV